MCDIQELNSLLQNTNNAHLRQQHPRYLAQSRDMSSFIKYNPDAIFKYALGYTYP